MASRGGTRSIVRLLVVFLAIVIIVDALVGDQGFLAMWRADQSYDATVSSIERQRQVNERLKEDIRRMTADDAAIEDAARKELGLIRKGEKVFIIKDLPSPAAP